ncbi:hypothetical protein BT96DRAFT_987541 [Gymnopus androsaceus JB14]|uniref:Uncharacterized protein n=1 Tax=Gymnopus androsaceus JB14 TaxID=1447944 RepID=A0A6A4I6Q9_9AGAR|nr:hypothetical protein BT96DRAFT_987541 [Gymnopus androsaceus JB14]
MATSDSEVMFTDPAFLDGETPAPCPKIPIPEPHVDSDLDSDSDSESVLDFDPNTGYSSNWQSQKPPTVVIALEALNHLETVLCPLMSGPQKCTKDSCINGWSKAHLEEVKRMLNLYTDQSSATYGEWQKSSVQADVVGRKNHSSLKPTKSQSR